MVARPKTYPTVGVCGLDCGLCPRYYTVGTSRCPGCGGPGFSDRHPSCSFITCCVKKRGLEACGQCPEFPCSKFKSEEDYRQAELSSSYPPDRKVLSNSRFIKEKGVFCPQGVARTQRAATICPWPVAPAMDTAGFASSVIAEILYLVTLSL